jgi:hypothetical protein
MKKTVLTFGLISGIMISVLMDGSVLLADKIGSGPSLLLGYANMAASFLLIYFGVRSYRDNILESGISCTCTTRRITRATPESVAALVRRACRRLSRRANR